MAATSFVHLHVHSHYSLLDGATRIEALVQRAKALGMPAVALTDHGNLFGAIEFYATAIKAGIKPILGFEAYLAVGDRRAKESRNGSESYHLLLLAMNRTGYHNLMRLASIGYTEGFYRRPRIDKQVLREFSEGLICTSTCIGGEIPQVLLQRDRAAAEDLAKSYLSIFGPDRFFVELQDHGIPEQKTLNPELADMATRLGVATIATNDVHYLDHDDVEAHDVLCCINTGSQIDKEDRFRFPTDQFFFKSTEEMSGLFPNRPEAIRNTLHVAKMCDLELDLSTRHAPVYHIPESVCGPAGERLDANDYFRQLVYEGARERYGEITDELRARIEYELGVITSKGFASYFLIVWDCVRYAREHGIPVGARGSGCSSVVSHCLHISAPDPIRYGLFFERFMDPDRDEMPDIDLDICQNGRAQIIDYVREKYGHVAQIITFGTLKARAVVKDVARVMGIGFNQANELTKLIPNELHITLDKALAQEPELKKRYESDPTIRKIVDVGRRLEGMARNAGVHAAGVVVADQPLVNFLPLYRAAGQETLVTQFDGPTVEKVGLLKMDFLGLRTLTILERARQLAQRSTGQDIDLDGLELNDARVFELFARGDTRGIFQFESGGMRDVIMRMKPNRIEDLIAANALFRPGPMEYIPEYIKRKHGGRWTTPHPIMSEVLEETHGIMVYQEQVSRVVNRLGGIELKDAFRLAKAISKKKASMIEAMREPFLSGCMAKGVQRAKAVQIFDDILKFGGYAFNKAHSTRYALVAYQTAWMKAHYPVEFMAALMTFEMSNTDKVAEYHEECKQMSIRVEPPCVNASDYEFKVERCAQRVIEATASSGNEMRVIRFGLGAIKGVGAKAVNAIAAERDGGGPFRSLSDFCDRVDYSAVNRATIEALICAGAFDRTGAMRKGLLDALEREMTAGQSLQRDRRGGQMGLFPIEACHPAPPRGGEREGPSPTAAASSNLGEWIEAEMLAKERSVLGFYITRHPLANHEALLRACATTTTCEMARCKEGEEVVLGGMVSSLRTVAARTGRNAGKRLGIVTFEDLAGRIEAIVFPDDLIRYRSILAPDVVLFLEGIVDRKREEPSLKVSRAVTAEEAVTAFADSLVLSISDETSMEQATALLREYNGECRVYLDVAAENDLIAQIECPPSLRVACTPALLEPLRDLLGANAVRVLGRQRRPIPPPNVSAPRPLIRETVPAWQAAGVAVTR